METAETSETLVSYVTTHKTWTWIIVAMKASKLS